MVPHPRCSLRHAQDLWLHCVYTSFGAGSGPAARCLLAAPLWAPLPSGSMHDLGHLLRCSLDICVSSGKCLLNLFIPTKAGLFPMLSLRVLSMLWKQALCTQPANISSVCAYSFIFSACPKEQMSSFW